MKVLKFGGTSVGNAERMKMVGKIIGTPGTKVIVLSAVSGTTDLLVRAARRLSKQKAEGAERLIQELKEVHLNMVEELFETEEFNEKGRQLVHDAVSALRAFSTRESRQNDHNAIVAHGELLSTGLFHLHLSERGVESQVLPALKFMRLNKNGEPDAEYIRKNIDSDLGAYPDQCTFITQGFIARNASGEVDNLRRGGSDYTATLIGAAIGAEEVQIWTDIDGMHNNDPRIIEGTKPLTNVSFDEAAELAYFGAKILHPSSVHPARCAKIPVRLKNTMDPDAQGTLIAKRSVDATIKAIAAKDNITAIRIKSGRMLLAHGFLRKVFEIFEIYQTSIDVITTSEVAVSITIDDCTNLQPITAALGELGAVEVEEGLSIICIVGDFIAESKGHAGTILGALKNIPLRMISFGGSRHNVSVLVRTENKEEALTSLNPTLS